MLGYSVNSLSQIGVLIGKIRLLWAGLGSGSDSKITLLRTRLLLLLLLILYPTN